MDAPAGTTDGEPAGCRIETGSPELVGAPARLEDVPHQLLARCIAQSCGHNLQLLLASRLPLVSCRFASACREAIGLCTRWASSPFHRCTPSRHSGRKDPSRRRCFTHPSLSTLPPSPLQTVPARGLVPSASRMISPCCPPPPTTSVPRRAPLLPLPTLPPPPTLE